MWEKLRIVMTIPELRAKVLLTLMLLGVYRIGYQVPLPVVDQSYVGAATAGSGFGDWIEKVSMFSASELSKATIFGLGIMPYISASIIFQLLGSVWPPLEALKKEGEAGRKKINEYTRYVTVLLCFVQSWMYVKFWLMAVPQGANGPPRVADAFESVSSGNLTFFWQFAMVMTMTCGTVFLMWLGEQIDEHGVGNGISLLIMAGIVARMPGAMYKLLNPENMDYQLTGFTKGAMGIETLVVLAFLFVAVVVGVVFITLGQRQIATQSAKHVRGRRVFGGTRNYLPLRINQAGVMPIIFASSLLMLPGLGFKMMASWFTGTTSQILQWLSSMFDGSSFIYNMSYIAMIFFFCFFWTAITFNPKEMADNLKDYGTFIPGYRPGKRTADYLEKVMVRITYVGAGFLALVAIVPTAISSALGVDVSVASFYGGTGLLIAVSVAFDLVQKIDSHLVMRNYRGLME